MSFFFLSERHLFVSDFIVLDTETGVFKDYKSQIIGEDLIHSNMFLSYDNTSSLINLSIRVNEFQYWNLGLEFI